MLRKLIRLVKKTKRRGQGYGSGKGGHTVGRGQKGQKSRGKGKPGILHEGGRIPVHRKIPKNKGRGFSPVSSYTSINIKDLIRALKKANLSPKVVNPKLLQKLGYKPARNGYRVYGTISTKTKFKLVDIKYTKGVKESLGL